ncbi:PREDICTED: uncharacterized protein LOC107191276 [Dufourea novaeangliae]|nr:PREDICTED: uncharacterized protein LOC107191276 [Dufourea novaeangliae]
MDDLQDQSDHGLIYCRYDNSTNNNTLMEYLELDNRTSDPLNEPEVTMNLNEGSVQLLLYPLEELEEDMFDYETDTSSQDGNIESQEQVVPSSQLSNNHKYPEELTISDDEIDDGGTFEDEPVSNLLLNDNDTDDSQPP